MNNSPGALYIVASPLGNLQDLSERAAETLRRAEVLFCEDTRRSKILLQHRQIPLQGKQLLSCNAHNERSRGGQLLEFLGMGRSVAYLSDAGTPGIADPGNLLVEIARQAGFPVIPIPGPSALSCLLSVCGFNLSRGFYFAGFLPRSTGKLSKLLAAHPLLFAYEAPYRIRKSVQLIAEIAPEAQLCLGRELTKLHEEILWGNTAELAHAPWKEKGEFTLGLCQPKKRS